jgi:hypothetical protein
LLAELLQLTQDWKEFRKNGFGVVKNFLIGY